MTRAEIDERLRVVRAQLDALWPKYRDPRATEYRRTETYEDLRRLRGNSASAR